MYHYTYRVSLCDKYYVGRHSTDDINDKYCGSGKWVRSLKNKSSLKKEIISFYNSFDELIDAERTLIEAHITNPNCMNFNNSPIGFAVGELNPSKSTFERQKRRNRFSGDLNPAKRSDVRQKISKSQRGKPSPHKGKKRSADYKKKLSEAKKGIKFSEEGKQKLSTSRKKQYLSGERQLPSFKGMSHTEAHKEYIRQLSLARKTLECPHCMRSFKPHTYKRWHGEKCKNA